MTPGAYRCRWNKLMDQLGVPCHARLTLRSSRWWCSFQLPGRGADSRDSVADALEEPRNAGVLPARGRSGLSPDFPGRHQCSEDPGCRLVVHSLVTWFLLPLPHLPATHHCAHCERALAEFGWPSSLVEYGTFAYVWLWLWLGAPLDAPLFCSRSRGTRPCRLLLPTT